MRTLLLGRLCVALAIQLTPMIGMAQSCGDVVVSNVTLSADLHCTTGYYALDVQANGVTIDLNGHTISGDPALAGINIVGYDNVRVTGPGKIGGFWTGVNAVRADGLVVEGVTFGAMTSGIHHNHASAGAIRNNVFDDISGIAVSLHATAHAPEPVIANRITGNTMSDVGMGIELCGDITYDNEISDNQIAARDIGITLADQARDNLLHDNFITGAGIAALALRNSENNEIYSEYYKDNWSGVWLVTEPPRSCHQNPARPMRTAYNRLDGVTLVDNQTALLFGGGTVTGPVVKNSVTWSKIYDNGVGADLRGNTIKNLVRYNAFHGTLTPILDAGTSNITTPNFP